jgi:molybdopterin/thiamine biosynthesis adenylyltransferase
MPVLDALAQDRRIGRVTIVEPDTYQAHNVERHLFPLSAVGQLKAELAQKWLLDRRPDLEVSICVADLTDPAQHDRIESAVATADIAVCAADNEVAKYHFDSLMRRHGKPWTLGEVLSGGIGGFVHWFRPGGPCYGCVASHLKRAIEVEKHAAPDYSQPGAPVAETRIPAGKASIMAIAGVHAVVTQSLMEDVANFNPGFTSLLLPLRQVPDIFREPFRPHRMTINRSPDCLICRKPEREIASEDLDVALNEALERLAHE